MHQTENPGTEEVCMKRKLRLMTAQRRNYVGLEKKKNSRVTEQFKDQGPIRTLLTETAQEKMKGPQWE